MEYKAIASLALWLRDALLAEHKAVVMATNARAGVERMEAAIVAEGYETGEISGKNAETRKAAENGVLASNTAYTELVLATTRLESEAALARIERTYREEHLKLTRAWLYQQAGEVLRR